MSATDGGQDAPAEADDDRVEPIDLTRPFTRAVALRNGFDPRRRAGTYRRLFHGIYLHSAINPSPLMVARAALLSVDATAWASHATAARALDLPIPALPGEHVTVLKRAHRRKRPDVTTHYAAAGRIITIDGVRVSAPAQLFVELATQLTLVDLVVVGDHMVRKEMVTVAALSKRAAAASGRGAALARRAASYVRAGVDSPMETRLRLLIVLAGLPEPEVNLLVGDETSKRKYDLSYRRSKTILEYDGRQHIEREEQWESDIARREAIDDDTWRILVFIAKDIYKTPEKTLTRIHEVLRARGEPALPKQLSESWRPHFPGHRAQ